MCPPPPNRTPSPPPSLRLLFLKQVLLCFHLSEPLLTKDQTTFTDFGVILKEVEMHWHCNVSEILALNPPHTLPCFRKLHTLFLFCSSDKSVSESRAECSMSTFSMHSLAGIHESLTLYEKTFM